MQPLDRGLVVRFWIDARLRPRVGRRGGMDGCWLVAGQIWSRRQGLGGYEWQEKWYWFV